MNYKGYRDMLKNYNQLKNKVKNIIKLAKNTTANSGLAQLGFEANFKVGFVLGNWFLNRYIWLTKSPTDAKPRGRCNKP